MQPVAMGPLFGRVALKDAGQDLLVRDEEAHPVRNALADAALPFEPFTGTAHCHADLDPPDAGQMYDLQADLGGDLYLKLVLARIIHERDCCKMLFHKIESVRSGT